MSRPKETLLTTKNENDVAADAFGAWPIYSAISPTFPSNFPA